MNYKSHIYKLSVFFILFVIGFIIYKQQITYKERFDVKSVKPLYQPPPIVENKYKYILPKDIQETICNDRWFLSLSQRILSELGNVLKYKTLTGGEEIEWLRNKFREVSSICSMELIPKFPSIKPDLNTLMGISSAYLKFSTNNMGLDSVGRGSWTDGLLTIEEWKKGSYNYIQETVDVFNNLRQKIDCFGKNDKIDYKSIILNMKRMQNILMEENLTTENIDLYTQYFTKIKTIFEKTDELNSDALSSSFKKDYIDLFGNNETAVKSDKSDYRGFQNKSVSGKTCQNWTSQSPHKHDRTASNYPNKGIGNHNYCRNPDSCSDIWCYTTDPDKRWEVCNLNDTIPFVLSQSYFKRKGTAKKINNWILFLEQKYKPTEGKDYNLIKGNDGNTNADQSVRSSFFEPLKIVSAGSYNAEQEQKNIPIFDTKDKGGYNLFRAVVVRPNVPIVSKSYSIKDSCQKEKKGIPLELGNTPLILKNFARDTSTGSKNNRYDSSRYFGYPKLYTIENILENGKNLNNKPKTYYLSYSGNTTRKTKNNPDVKPLYHIRAHNPISGEFDYAYDVGSTDFNSNVSLTVGRVDGSVETSLFTIEPDVNEEKIALLSYGFRGYGENSGKNHYFYHKFDQSGRETETLSPMNETNAQIWNLKKITV